MLLLLLLVLLLLLLLVLLLLLLLVLLLLLLLLLQNPGHTCANALQSSSPSYLLMASLDGARALAQQQGIWEEPLRAAQLIVAQLQELPGLQVMSESIVGERCPD